MAVGRGLDFSPLEPRAGPSGRAAAAAGDEAACDAPLQRFPLPQVHDVSRPILLAGCLVA